MLNMLCRPIMMFSDVAQVPQKWCEYLNCRQCKQQLVKYLGTAFLALAPMLLSNDQKLVVSGCYEGGRAMALTTECMPDVDV